MEKEKVTVELELDDETFGMLNISAEEYGMSSENLAKIIILAMVKASADTITKEEEEELNEIIEEAAKKSSKRLPFDALVLRWKLEMDAMRKKKEDSENSENKDITETQLRTAHEDA